MVPAEISKADCEMENGVRIPVRVVQPGPYVSRRSGPASEGRLVESPVPPEQQSPDPAAVEGQQVDTGADQAYDNRAVGEALEIRHEPLHRMKAPYFVEYVRKFLESNLGSAKLYKGGLTIFTTLDYELQHAAEIAVKKRLAELVQG